jgi:chromosome segregation ATPase
LTALQLKLDEFKSVYMKNEDLNQKREEERDKREKLLIEELLKTRAELAETTMKLEETNAALNDAKLELEGTQAELEIAESDLDNAKEELLKTTEIWIRTEEKLATAEDEYNRMYDDLADREIGLKKSCKELDIAVERIEDLKTELCCVHVMVDELINEKAKFLQLDVKKLMRKKYEALKGFCPTATLHLPEPQAGYIWVQLDEDKW